MVRVKRAKVDGLQRLEFGALALSSSFNPGEGKGPKGVYPTKLSPINPDHERLLVYYPAAAVKSCQYPC